MKNNGEIIFYHPESTLELEVIYSEQKANICFFLFNDTQHLHELLSITKNIYNFEKHT